MAYQLLTFDVADRIATITVNRPDKLNALNDALMAELGAAIDEATAARDSGQRRVILFNLSGHGHFDMGAYDAYLAGSLQDYAYPAEAIQEALGELPNVAVPA